MSVDVSLVVLLILVNLRLVIFLVSVDMSLVDLFGVGRHEPGGSSCRLQ